MAEQHRPAFDGALDAEQRRLYAEQGYLLLRGLFDEVEMKPWVERFLQVVNEEVPPAEGMLVMRDVMVAKGAVRPGSRAEAIAKIQDFQSDPVLFDGYVRNEKLLDVVQCVTGPDVKSIHTMLINKPPHVDGRHPLHQDLLYFPFRPADRIVATWTALEPCTRENGCLVVLPGTHEGELREHGDPDWEWVNFAYWGAKDVGPDARRIHLEMEPGDTVIFHPLLLHGSGQNRTEGFRRAISAHYASAGCRYVEGASPVGPGRPYLPVRGREHEGCI